ATFRRSKLNHGLRGSGDHRLLWTLYRDLLRLRREVGALARLSREDLEVTADEGQGGLVVRRWSEGDEALAVFHTGDAGAAVDLPRGGSGWRKRIDSAEERWGGSGSPVPDLIDERSEGELQTKPHSFVLFTKEGTEGVNR